MLFGFTLNPSISHPLMDLFKAEFFYPYVLLTAYTKLHLLKPENIHYPAIIINYSVEL